MTTQNNILPDHAYLATQYLDRQGGVETRRVYYDDGLVEAFDGKEWWTVCRFSPEQVQAAKDAVLVSGLPAAKDLSEHNIHDTAELRFSWRIGTEGGVVTNYAYPAIDHPVFNQLELELDKLETVATAGIGN